jgi:hypothetical protein
MIKTKMIKSKNIKSKKIKSKKIKSKIFSGGNTPPKLSLSQPKVDLSPQPKVDLSPPKLKLKNSRTGFELGDGRLKDGSSSNRTGFRATEMPMGRIGSSSTNAQVMKVSPLSTAKFKKMQTNQTLEQLQRMALFKDLSLAKKITNSEKFNIEFGFPNIKPKNPTLIEDLSSLGQLNKTSNIIRRFNMHSRL